MNDPNTSFHPRQRHGVVGRAVPVGGRALLLAALFAGSGWAAEPLRIVIIGDSTVCDFPASRPQRGWGQFVEEQFQPGAVKVLNLARSGRSSKSFITEGLWERAKAQRPDFVLIQFGHNDSHARTEPKATDADGDFKEYLRRYADETRALGATPIFITPMHRRTFHSDGSLNDILKPYAEAMKTVAAEKAAAVIDLHTMSGELFARLGEKGSEQFANAPGDRTHFNEAGARAMAGLVMKQLPAAEPRLAKWLRPGQR